MEKNRYSIKDLENLTQIKAHTIRIWEQRYGLLKPSRTKTNIRYYDDNDLKKILNVNLLYTNGLKISKIAQISDADILKSVAEVQDSYTRVNKESINQLISYVIEINEEALRSELDAVYQRVGMLQLYTDYFIPLLVRIGELWQLNTLSVGHEHFTSALIRNFLIEKTALLPIRKSGKKVLLFLNAGEEHEISLLLYHYLFRKGGYNTYYLGQNMPLADLSKVINQLKPELLITCIIKYINKETFQEILKELNKFAKGKNLILSGIQATQYEYIIKDSATLIKGSKDLENYFV